MLLRNLLIALALLFTLSAQSQTLVPAEKGLSNLANKQAIEDNQRWYNYGATMANIYGASVRYFDVPLFPDTAKRMFANGNTRSIFTLYLANVLDPKSEQFALEDVNDFVNFINITDNNDYQFDSLSVEVRYMRNAERYNKYTQGSSIDTASIQRDTVSNAVDTIKNRYTILDSVYIDTTSIAIVDTLLIEIFNNKDPNNMIDTFLCCNSFGIDFNDAYGVDTVKFKNIKYDPISNTMDATSKTQYKFPMDSVYSVVSGTDLIEYKVAASDSGAVLINAGELIGMGYSFIAGSDHIFKSYSSNYSETLDSVRMDTTVIRKSDDSADSLVVIDSIVLNIKHSTLLVSSKDDTITDFNSFEVQAYEEQGDPSFPIYFEGEWNNSYEMGAAIRYNLPDTVRDHFYYRLDPRYTGDIDRQMENLDVAYLLTCATCFKTSVEDNSNNIAIQNIYPNPLSKGGFLKVPFEVQDGGNVNVEVYGILGNKVFSHSVPHVAGKNLLELNTGTLQAGSYIISLEKNGIRQSKGFLVQP